MYVQVKSAPLKSSTGFFARTQGTVYYGDQITVLAVNGKWAQVQPMASRSQSGWVASANLTSKRIIAQGDTRSASARELALAGKGFSEEVERQYKAGNNLNYAPVDYMERLNIPDEALLSFIEEGRLRKGE